MGERMNGRDWKVGSTRGVEGTESWRERRTARGGWFDFSLIDNSYDEVLLLGLLTCLGNLLPLLVLMLLLLPYLALPNLSSYATPTPAPPIQGRS